MLSIIQLWRPCGRVVEMSRKCFRGRGRMIAGENSPTAQRSRATLPWRGSGNWHTESETGAICGNIGRRFLSTGGPRHSPSSAFIWPILVPARR
jgi:hypothetical protein